jgi:hypothetical protein
LVRFQNLCFETCFVQSICIPRSLEVLCQSCFRGGCIETLRFENGSSLTDIDESCFEAGQLESICIPRSVERLDERAFALAKIGTLVFEPESRLATIGTECFVGC